MGETKKIFLSNRNVLFMLLLHFYLLIDRWGGGFHLSNIVVHSNQQSKMYSEFILYLFCILMIPSIIALIKNKFDGYSVFIILYNICMGWLFLVGIGWAISTSD